MHKDRDAGFDQRRRGLGLDGVFAPQTLWYVVGATFVAEREVVKEERRMRIENPPYGLLNELISFHAYDVHPYKHPVIGSMNDLNAATIADVRDFYAATVMARLGHGAEGLVRAGCACYTTGGEVARLIDGVRAVATSATWL